MRIEPARDADLSTLAAYLAERADTCMFLCSNLRAAGLRWDGARYQGQYMLAWDGDALVGVIAHAWNGMLTIQADAPLAELAAETVRHSGRKVAGFTGPLDQVHAARAALGLVDAPTLVDDDETLMALSLDQLVIPPTLASGAVRVRRGTADDRRAIAAWRAAYLIEAGGASPGAATDTEAAQWFDAALAEATLWIAERDGAPVAMTAFNARLPERVQVGGVFTPSPMRSRGHARAVVAGALLDARETGVERAILFTPRADALAAYSAIGFEPIGRYGIVLLAG
jgi:GNAT superfamily N-acetyltransferase